MKGRPGERLVRNEEASGSIPLRSTNPLTSNALRAFWCGRALLRRRAALSTDLRFIHWSSHILAVSAKLSFGNEVEVGLFAFALALPRLHAAAIDHAWAVGGQVVLDIHCTLCCQRVAQLSF